MKDPIYFSWVGTRMLPSVDEAERLGLDDQDRRRLRNFLKRERRRDRHGHPQRLKGLFTIDGSKCFRAIDGELLRTAPNHP